MEDDESGIMYTYPNLKNELEKTGSKPEVVVTKYLQELIFPPIGDFLPGLEWMNVSQPLTFKEHLKGKIVVLDFFTYCCINCMHILPDLKELENKYSIEDGLVVVGVHSPKFENEKDSGNILSAVQRYNIGHPVVNDFTRDMWKKCDIMCWPTLLVLGPYANPILMIMGEGHKNELISYIGYFLSYYKQDDLISNHSLPLKSAYHLLPDLKGPLLFPGKITTISSGNDEIMAISDSGNNRILILLNRVIIKQVGSSKSGFVDGKISKAEFNQPQGVAFQNTNVLFVADTENHAVRKVDLINDTVTTVIGTGKQCDDESGGKIGREQGISSPWDVCIYKMPDNGKEVMIIAMAGTHQIWALFLEDTIWWKNKEYKAGVAVAIAGNGKEENRNNQYPNNAAFAQPSGLALCNKTREIFIADSESSTVRKLSLIDGRVSAVVGGDKNPNNLFAFGDKDGILQDAKLQHALGLAVSSDENTLFVADSYNHKIKKVDISKNSISTLHIPGDELPFKEPAGLCISSNSEAIYVADTNNHCIKILNLDKDNQVTKITKMLLSAEQSVIASSVDKSRFTILTPTMEEISKQGGKINLNMNLTFINNIKLTEGAPHNWMVDLPNALWSSIPNSGTDMNNIDLVINATPHMSEITEVDVIFSIMTCKEDLCFPLNFIVRQTIKFSDSGNTTLDKSVTAIIDVNKVELKCT